jgi:hypothetical protein
MNNQVRYCFGGVVSCWIFCTECSIAISRIVTHNFSNHHMEVEIKNRRRNTSSWSNWNLQLGAMLPPSMSKAAAISSHRQDMILTRNAQMGMSSTSWQTASCYYPFDMCRYDALLKMIDYGLCVVAEIPVASTNSRSLALRIINGRTAPDTPTTNHLLACQL